MFHWISLSNKTFYEEIPKNVQANSTMNCDASLWDDEEEEELNELIQSIITRSDVFKRVQT